MMRPQIVLMVASLFSSSPGECRCPTGHCSTDPSCKPIHEHFAIVPGYNVPDQIAINDCWSIFAFGEFTYQIPLQENMELGFVNDRRNTSVHQDGAWINPDFEYKPGFKLGIGVSFDQDHWDLHAEYAWYRGIQDTSRSVDLTGSLEIYPLAPLANIQSTVFGKAKQSWRLEMDILDLTLSRHYSVGTSLSFHPFLAFRSAWIRQGLKNSYQGELTGSVSFNSVEVHEKSHSWAVGPRLGIDLDWAIGSGFDFYSNGGGDLLFTRYTRLRTDQKAILLDRSIDPSYSYKYRQYNVACLRNHFDLEFGLHWGTHFASNQWHYDIRVGYVVEAFFDQNMFRFYADDTAVAKSTCPNGNLFIHGLCVKMRADF